jgi:hypothetical protein
MKAAVHIYNRSPHPYAGSGAHHSRFGTLAKYQMSHTCTSLDARGTCMYPLTSVAN